MPIFCDNCGRREVNNTRYCSDCTDMAFDCADFLFAVSKYMTECYGPHTILCNVNIAIEAWKQNGDYEEFNNALKALRTRFP